MKALKTPQNAKESVTMKRKLLMISSVSAVSVWALSAVAQDTSPDQTNESERVPPAVSDNARSNAVDNTARNVRDRDNRTQTPFDQGNNQADINTTSKIRKEILAGKNMSVDARNVKIITNQGKVTLRGPVNTAEEKRLIGECGLSVGSEADHPQRVVR